MRMFKVLILLMGTLFSRAQPEAKQPTWEDCLRLSSKTPLVVVFLDPECPLSINYTFTVNELATAYGKNVCWLLVFPGVSAEPEAVDDFCRDYGLDLPLCLDADLSLSRHPHPEVTPEVAVLHNGQVVYSGALDDWAVDLGKVRKGPVTPWLRQVLDALLSGKPSPHGSHPATGCKISWK